MGKTDTKQMLSTISHSVELTKLINEGSLVYIDQTTNPLWLIVFNSYYQVQYSVITLESLWLQSQLYYSSYFLQEDPFTILVQPATSRPSRQRNPTA